MTPAARIQAAIELLDAVIAGTRTEGAPADRLIADYFRTRRYAGSKDRRAVRELVYRAIRACGPIPDSGRAAMLRLAQVDPPLRDLFDGSTHGPPPIGTAEQAATGGLAPDWLVARLARSDVTGEEALALLERAPLDIRVNTLKAERGTLVLPEPGEILPTPHGIRFDPGTNVEQWAEYRDGAIEVQDAGSQMACMAVGAQPGEMVIDLCAGAGGKTLALAAAMENRGTLIASDTDRGRLSKLGPRARRAGATIVESVLLDPNRELEALERWHGSADRVLIDAPCSGTGTWRRKPEAKWRLTEAALARYTAMQDRLLSIATRLAAPGGTVTFVTCSLLDEEGAGRIAAFLADNPGWQPLAPSLPAGTPRGAGVRFSPAQDRTDGFFIATLTRAC